MPTTLSMAGGKGVFVGSGYMTFTATPDFGQSWTTFSLYKLPADPRGKPVTHHIRAIYCGDASGRFLALGDNRGTEGPKFGHLFASDDLGQDVAMARAQRARRLHRPRRDGLQRQAVLMTDATGENAWRSLDAGKTWDGPYPTGTKRGDAERGQRRVLAHRHTFPRQRRRSDLARPPRRPFLPAKVVASDKGTLISIDLQRFNILRSTDGGTTWQEVFTFKPETENVHGAQGLRDAAFGFVTGK